MSLRYVVPIALELPYALREQVVTYARAVDHATVDIFAEAEVDSNEELHDQLVLLAAIRKLHGICSSSFWILHNATSLLGAEASVVRIGSSQLDRGGDVYWRLRILLDGLTATLEAQGISTEMLQQPYVALARMLADGRSQS